MRFLLRRIHHLRPLLFITLVFLALAGGYYAAQACGGGPNAGYFMSRYCTYNDQTCPYPDQNACKQDMCNDTGSGGGYNFCYSCTFPGYCDPSHSCYYPVGTCCQHCY